MQWFRARTARIAAVTIVSMAVIGGSAVVSHEDDCHDAACRTFIVEHDASAHRVGGAAAGTDHHPLHCVVCHWARSFRPRTETRVASLPAAGAGISLPLALFSISAAAPVSQPPLRSPPSSLS